MFTFFRTGSIRRQMLFWVNTVLTLSLTLFLVIDFRHDWNKRLADKREAMLIETKLIGPVVARLSQVRESALDTAAERAAAAMATTMPLNESDLDLEANLPASEKRRINLLGSAVVVKHGSVGAVVDSFLRSVRDRNETPEEKNYQIAARIGDQWFRTKRSSVKPFLSNQSLKSLGDADWGVVDLRDEQMMVTSTPFDNGMVYVAESLTQIQGEARELLVWRTTGLALIGLGITALIDLILVRLVSRPLVALVRAVRDLRQNRSGVAIAGGACREVGSLVAGVNRLSQRLDKAEAHRVRQMEKARRMQENLYPKAQAEGPVKIQCIHTAANVVGGDYYDHKLMSDGSVVVVLADVSGHGVAAAMGAAMLKTLFDSYTDRYTNLREIIDGINRGFHKVSLDEDFATIVLIRIDTVNRKLQFVNAGHETVFVLDGVGRHSADGVEAGPNSDWSDLVGEMSGQSHRSRKEESSGGGGTALAVAERTETKVSTSPNVTSRTRGVRELNSNGPLVGVMPDIEWDVDEIDYSPGDRLVVYTDGITEARSISHGMLGRKRFLEMMTWNQRLDLKHYCQSILREVDDFREGLPPSDDVTLLAMEY